jgi:hypothetical protein
MSDMVTCRLWMPVAVKEFYNPVLTLLEAIGEEPDAAPSFSGMRWVNAYAINYHREVVIGIFRTISEIRRDQQIAIPVNKDSLYKPVTRVRKEFSKILIPKKLQEVIYEIFDAWTISAPKCCCDLGPPICIQAEAASDQEQEIIHGKACRCAGA